MEFCTIFRRLLILFLTLTSICPTSQQHLSVVDLNALHQIKYTLTDVKNGGTFSTWNFSSTVNPCYSFSGVTCSVINHKLRVTSLFLGTGLSDSPGLAGTISTTGLYDLTELTQLVLYPGIVTGFIPSQIGRRLKNLRVISLTNNQLTGTIPASISELQNLHTLDLSHNKLIGVIPPTLALALLELRVLVLAYNNLAGKIPAFSNQSQLVHLDLKNNKLSGTLPGTMPSTLRYLSLSNNGLRGPLNWVPSSYLVYLDLSMNKFSGPLPNSLFRSTLSSMYLQRNYFSGNVPRPPPSSFYESYGPGSIIDLSHNFLSGEIPDFLASVEILFLNNNHFTGEAPQSYVTNVFAGTTRTLYLQHNFIVSFPIEKSRETVLPDGVALCLKYNCMVTPAVGLTGCPANAGGLISRPSRQCSVISGENSMG